ncbi:MAG: glycosyltransferase family 2 protein [Proteobacteria bacterium]|nr:glycosyltransferase family 2 protein [Pseudomonadota bacterium]
MTSQVLAPSGEGTPRPRLSVSVVIPTYRGREYLVPCLDAVACQTRPADQVIVVDDASPDDTAQWVRDTYPWVDVVALPTNRKFAGAANAGIRASAGDIVVLLNNDTEAEPGWLAALVAPLEAEPEVGFCASKLLLFDRRDHLHAAGDGYTIGGCLPLSCEGTGGRSHRHKAALCVTPSVTGGAKRLVRAFAVSSLECGTCRAQSPSGAPSTPDQPLTWKPWTVCSTVPDLFPFAQLAQRAYTSRGDGPSAAQRHQGVMGQAQRIHIKGRWSGVSVSRGLTASKRSEHHDAVVHVDRLPRDGAAAVRHQETHQRRDVAWHLGAAKRGP